MIFAKTMCGICPQRQERHSRPTSDAKNFTVTKMGIDTTRPAGIDFAERLTFCDEQRGRARKLLAAMGINP
jgi:hypothetical protein